MTYQRTTVVQKYGDQNYLAHQIQGNVQTEPFNFVSDRIESYGIISIGAMKAGEKKRFKPADIGIQQDISLRSIFAFTNSASNDAITLRLFLNNQEVLEQFISNSEMPYAFPNGAILNPQLELEIQPRYHTIQVVIYWQPVHVLSYNFIE